MKQIAKVPAHYHPPTKTNHRHRHTETNTTKRDFGTGGRHRNLWQFDLPCLNAGRTLQSFGEYLAIPILFSLPLKSDGLLLLLLQGLHLLLDCCLLIVSVVDHRLSTPKQAQAHKDNVFTADTKMAAKRGGTAATALSSQQLQHLCSSTSSSAQKHTLYYLFVILYIFLPILCNH